MGTMSINSDKPDKIVKQSEPIYIEKTVIVEKEAPIDETMKKDIQQLYSLNDELHDRFLDELDNIKKDMTNNMKSVIAAFEESKKVINNIGEVVNNQGAVIVALRADSIKKNKKRRTLIKKLLKEKKDLKDQLNRTYKIMLIGFTITILIGLIF